MLKRSGGHISFHTPGHKQGKWDITELSFSDNLSSPRGCIARAEADIARLLGAEKSYILTDGSTSGVLAMLYAAKALGVERVALIGNAHKSVWNGCRLLGLTPLVCEEEAGNETPFPHSRYALNANFTDIFERADALFVTTPDYYGRVADLAVMRAYCTENKKLFLVDGAHGGHLRFDGKLYAGSYADMWVDGVHKSLPALTQGGVVSAKKERFAKALGEGVDVFRTTSPSYPIMASVEYAVKYPRNEKLENAVRAYADRESRIYLAEDWTKLCALFGKHAFAAHSDLEGMGIYPEFCDGNIVEFYLSPATKKSAFIRLQKALKRLFITYPYEEEKSVQRVPAPLVSPKNGESAWVALDEAVGKLCAADCGLFPPCTPLIFAGERIEEDKITLLKKAVNVYGLVDGKIRIWKE